MPAAGIEAGTLYLVISELASQETPKKSKQRPRFIVDVPAAHGRSEQALAQVSGQDDGSWGSALKSIQQKWQSMAPPSWAKLTSWPGSLRCNLHPIQDRWRGSATCPERDSSRFTGMRLLPHPKQPFAATSARCSHNHSQAGRVTQAMAREARASASPAAAQGQAAGFA